jgi:hypothetical protein
MVITPSPKEHTMRTTSSSRSRTVKCVAGLSVALASLAIASPLGAIPNHDPNDPTDEPGPPEPPDPPEPPEPIVAKLSATPFAPLVGSTITLDASGSSDPLGGTLSYSFDLDRNGSFESTSASPTRTVTATGAGPQSYRVRVRTAPNRFDFALDVVRVHRAPTAVITPSLPAIVTGQQVTFSGAASTDDGSIAKYEWDLDGNGSFERSTGATPTVTTSFPTPGAPVVGLRVTDNDAATGTATTSVAVLTPPSGAVANDLTGPSVRILTTRARAKNGAVKVRVACPATESTCAVRLTLRGIARPLTGKSLGSARTTLAGGQTLNLRVPLSRAAKKAVTRRGTLRARVVVLASDSLGNSTIRTSRMSITRR